MSTPPSSSFCSQPQHGWPFAQARSALTLTHCQFDTSLFHPDDFDTYQIPAIPGSAKRQAEHLAGRLCARLALETLNQGTQTINSHADGAPRWPQGIVGSITHSGSHALAVAASSAHYSGVGLDIEQQMPMARAQKLSAEILTPAEIERARTCSDDFAWLTTLSFSVKESLFKALYPQIGRRFYFQDAQLLNWHESGTVQIQLLKDLSPKWRAGVTLEGLFCNQQQYILTLISTAATS